MHRGATNRIPRWFVFGAWCGGVGACAHGVEPNYQPEVAASGVGGNVAAVPSSTGSPSQVIPNPNVPASGGAPGVGTGGGSTQLASGGTPAANTSGGGAPAAGGAAPATGGSTSPNDAFLCDPNVQPLKAVSVSAKSSTGLAPTNQIGLALNLVHTGAALTAIPLNALSVRYWFSADTVTGLVVDCDFAMLGCANIRTRFVSASVAGADTYLEVGFTSGAGNLAPNGETGEIQLRFHSGNYQGEFLLGNDPSAATLTDAYLPQEAITAYHACGLVWGTEPLAN